MLIDTQILNTHRCCVVGTQQSAVRGRNPRRGLCQGDLRSPTALCYLALGIELDVESADNAGVLPGLNYAHLWLGVLGGIGACLLWLNEQLGDAGALGLHGLGYLVAVLIPGLRRVNRIRI